MAARADVTADVGREVESRGERWHLSVLVEDPCGDAINTLPVLAAPANRAPNVDVFAVCPAKTTRISCRRTSPALRVPFLSSCSSTRMTSSANGRERVPSPLQRWVIKAGRALTKEDR